MKLLLATLHAKQAHASLALPTLAAVCSDVAGVSIHVGEYTVNERLETILARLVALEADVVAFSCYIWNIGQTLQLAAELKLITPHCYIVLGGPEVSFGSHELMAAHAAIDCIVRGEGEATLVELLPLLAECPGQPPTDDRLAGVCGISFRSGADIVTTPERSAIMDLDAFPSPFAAGLVATNKPLVYYETARGCPFSCAFCLSSQEGRVRAYSFARVQSDLALLIDRGVETIKLVDRTFNYDAVRANQLWEFILRRNRTSRFHFEIAADLLTEDNLRLLQRVPADMFRFEIGVQSVAATTLASVARKSDLEKLFANVARLRAETAITLHLDLVAGLPGEDLPGFSRSLGRLLAARPDHIQVEAVKVLKGTAMRKIAREQGYLFSPYPPYRILKNPWLSFADISRIETAAQALERFYNSGRFRATLALVAAQTSLAELFIAPTLASILAESGHSSTIALCASLHRLVATVLSDEALAAVTEALLFDYCLTGYPGNSLPLFLTGSAGGERLAKPPLSHPEIARLLSIPATTRIRTCTVRFSRDYSGSLPAAGPCVTIFAYYRQDGAETVRTICLPLH